MWRGWLLLLLYVENTFLSEEWQHAAASKKKADKSRIFCCPAHHRKIQRIQRAWQRRQHILYNWPANLNLIIYRRESIGPIVYWYGRHSYYYFILFLKNKKRRATREQLKGVSRVRFFFISSRRSAMLFFIIAFTQTGRVETHSTARPPI